MTMNFEREDAQAAAMLPGPVSVLVTVCVSILADGAPLSVRTAIRAGAMLGKTLSGVLSDGIHPVVVMAAGEDKTVECNINIAASSEVSVEPISAEAYEEAMSSAWDDEPSVIKVNVGNGPSG